jgi:type I restriction enzyme R subunit
MSEVLQAKDGDLIDETIHAEIKTTIQALVNMFDQATEIVDFFNKPDEMKRMKKEIKHAVLDQSFGDRALVNVLQERFMDLAKTKFAYK